MKLWVDCSLYNPKFNSCITDCFVLFGKYETYAEDKMSQIYRQGTFMH